MAIFSSPTGEGIWPFSAIVIASWMRECLIWILLGVSVSPGKLYATWNVFPALAGVNANPEQSGFGVVCIPRLGGGERKS